MEDSHIYDENICTKLTKVKEKSKDQRSTASINAHLQQGISWYKYNFVWIKENCSYRDHSHFTLHSPSLPDSDSLQL
jgi:hypothetical protein